MGLTRRQILAETLARLEAERFAGPRRPQLSAPRADPPPAITDDQAAQNARQLMEAIGATEEDVVLMPPRRWSA